MKVKLILFNKELKNFYGVKPEYSDLYFCSTCDGNNKTSHLLKHLINGNNSWISLEGKIFGIITLEKWLTVGGDIERWLSEKIKEFDFLIGYAS